MARFRRSLAKVLVESTPVQILRGRPPETAVNYRNFILELFASTGSNVALKKYLLQRLPNGLWTRTDRVEVYVEPGIEVDEPKLQRQVITALLICLCSRSFQTHPRHRWLGADIACDQIGLAESIHGLASAAYLRMQQEAGEATGGSRARRQGPLAPGRAMGAEGGTHEAHAPPMAARATTAEAEAAQMATSEQDVGEGGPEVGEGAKDPSASFAEMNAKRVRVASQWLQEKPLPHIMALRLCLAPLRDLLSLYIKRSGQKWSTEQAAQTATLMSSGEGQMGSSPLAEYVKLSAERQFFKDVQELTSSPRWQFLAREAGTLEFESIIFRMTSRMAASVHQLLVVPTQSCPLKLLTLVTEGPHKASDLQNTPKCCQDSYTQAHMAAFPGLSLASADSIACLQGIVSVVPTETVGIEWGHQRVHRLISKSSVQTRAPSMEYISSQFLCQKVQQQAKDPVTSLPSNQPEKLRQPADPDVFAAVEDQGRPLKRRRGGGGAYRAFISKRSRGKSGQADMAALTAAYRASKAANDDEYQEALRAGRAATLRHKSTTSRGFGPSQRSLRRKLVATHRSSQSSRTLQSAELGSSWDLGFGPERVALQLDLDAEMALARSSARRSRREARLEAEAPLRILQQHCELQQPEWQERIYTCFPELLQVPTQIYFCSEAPLATVQVVFDSIDPCQAIASWASCNARRSNVQRALKEDWARRAQPVRTASDVAQEPPSRKAVCLDMGRCVCSQTGKELLRQRNQLLKSLKELLSSKVSGEKAMLENGQVVLLLQEERVPVSAAALGSYATRLLQMDTNEEAQAPKLCGKVWLHIAMQYFSPYRPTFQLLQHGSELAEDLYELEQTFTYTSLTLRCAKDCDRWEVGALRSGPSKAQQHQWHP